MEEQFYLSTNSNMSLFDTNNIPDFEREFMVGELIKYLKKKKEL
jgi:hypothetical protein